MISYIFRQFKRKLEIVLTNHITTSQIGSGYILEGGSYSGTQCKTQVITFYKENIFHFLIPQEKNIYPKELTYIQNNSGMF